jgi:hypothetical protein
MQFRELLAECERGDPLACFRHSSRAHRGPDPHEEMDVIGLDGKLQNRPAFLVTPLANQAFAAFANRVHQHLSPAVGTPDEVVDKQTHLLFVASVVRIALVVPPVDTLPLYLQVSNQWYR